MIEDEINGSGPIGELLKDKDITEIMINGPHDIYIEIDGKKVKASRVKLKKVDKEKNTSLVDITIHEGRNHQVKKMFESVGFHVSKLKRERLDIFDLKDLQSGEYRRLTPKEVQIIYSYKNKKEK